MFGPLVLAILLTAPNPFVGTWIPVNVAEEVGLDAYSVEYAAAKTDGRLAFTDEAGPVFEADLEGKGNVFPGVRDSSISFQLRKTKEGEYALFGTKDGSLVFTEHLTVSKDGNKLERVVNTFDGQGGVQTQVLNYVRAKQPKTDQRSQRKDLPLQGRWRSYAKPAVDAPSERIRISEDSSGLLLKTNNQEILLRWDGKSYEVPKHTSAEPTLTVSTEAAHTGSSLRFTVYRAGKVLVRASVDLGNDHRTLTMTMINIDQKQTYVQKYQRQQ